MKIFTRILLLTFVMAVLFTTLSETGYTQETEKDLPDEIAFVPVENMPEMIYQEKPEYPEEAEEADVEGTVLIKALVDSEGKVTKVKIGKSSGNELLDKAAVKSAYKCKFKPATQKDKPVATWISYSVKFNLGDCDETEK